MADKDDSEKDEPVIRDKRRIDPETGDVRAPEAGGTAAEKDADIG